MNRNGLKYEAPKTKIYRFDNNDRILTESGIAEPLIYDYAANALNDFMDVTNTTIE